MQLAGAEATELVGSTLSASFRRGGSLALPMARY